MRRCYHTTFTARRPAREAMPRSRRPLALQLFYLTDWMIALVFKQPSDRIQHSRARAAVPARPERRGCRETPGASDCLAVTF